MSLSPVWGASRDVGRELKRSSPVQIISGAIDRPQRKLEPHERAVEHLLAAFGALRHRPLLVGVYAPGLLGQGPPGTDELLTVPKGPEFIEAAQSAARATISIIEFIRSRLPGYPNLLVPDTTKVSPRVASKGFMGRGYPWPHDARILGLQRSSAPPLQLLKLEDERPLAEAVLELTRRLMETDAWCSFQEATKSLSPQDVTDLKQIRHDFRQAAATKTLDETVGPLMMRINEARQAALEQAQSGATGASARYLQTFSTVDKLIDDVAAVFSDIAIYSGPIVIPGGSSATWQEVDGRIEATLALDGFFQAQPGRLVLYAEPGALQGGLLVTAYTFKFEVEAQDQVTVRATLLPDSHVLLN